MAFFSGSYIIHEAVEYCLKVDWHKLKMCVVNFKAIFKNQKEKNIANPVVMYGCESWTIKKAEHWRIYAFELWCWRRFLRVPGTARSNQSILKEISPEYSLEGLMLKLKLLYFGTWCEELTHWKRPWCWERLKAGGEGDDRGWDSWIASLTRWTGVWASSRSWWWTGKPGVLQSMGSQRVRHDWVTELSALLFLFLIKVAYYIFILLFNLAVC